ncbi:hypothetical protein MICAC_5570004 [Microcystis aeruginosa PCC 9443]|uniref:Uncharacterized protein n=1 Tax=Microcystis aeruginosa PCC 9443 TaxID=1160281 RepID=I4G8Z5_MICAE|nr:hypothetical protein MICAC_5570004 [Microcystis aeruginosa PCC 9443]
MYLLRIRNAIVNKEELKTASQKVKNVENVEQSCRVRSLMCILLLH